MLSAFCLFLHKTPEGVALLMVSIAVFSFLHSIDILSSGLWVDSISCSMVLLTVFVSSMVVFTSMHVSGMGVFISLGMLVAMGFFLSDSILLFFILFEMSLIPLTFLILSWGRQAERLLATQFMLIFTVVASAPLLVFTLWSMEESPSLFLLNLTKEANSSLPSVLNLSLVAFLVKIPMFFLHSWLPKAHVEAPLEGSMVLAGVMLKVGTFGIIRVMLISETPGYFLKMIFSISLVGALMSSVIALSSDDMKMSVAFSSISHMNMVVASVTSMKLSGALAGSVIMVAHGVSSPLLFYLVTKIYLLTQSRSILISKGVLSKLPFLWFFGLMLWVVNISPPPLFPFLGEMLGFSSILSYFPWSMVWVVMFMVIGSFYSIVNFGVQAHSSFKKSVKSMEIDLLFPLLSILVIFVSTTMFFFQPPLWS